MSVIVPVYNARRTILAQLEALAAQDLCTDGEIVVADNGSTDGTRRSLVHFARGHPRIRLVDAARRRGAAHARNVGAGRARGSVLLFCDADDVVQPGWAAALTRCLTNTDVALVAGRVVHGALDAPGGTQRWQPAIHEPPPPADSGPAPFAEACNMAVTRDAFEAVGGFDEDLAIAAEDVDFSARIRRAGLRLGYCPDAVVHYRDRATLPAALRQAYRYGRGNRLLAAPDAPGAESAGGAARRLLAECGRSAASMTSFADWATHQRRAAFWAGYLVSALGASQRPSG